MVIYMKYTPIYLIFDIELEIHFNSEFENCHKQ